MYAVINWVAKYESNLSPIPLNLFIQAALLKLAAVYLRKDILLREYIVQIPMVTVLLLRTNV